MSNIYARIFNRPAFVPTCIGSLLLIPSSLGVRGITGVIVSGDVVSAVQFTSALFATAVSMVVGGCVKREKFLLMNSKVFGEHGGHTS